MINFILGKIEFAPSLRLGYGVARQYWTEVISTFLKARMVKIGIHFLFLR